MTGTFAYSSSQNVNYRKINYQTIRNEIDARRPVILSGYNIRKTSWFGLIVKYKEGHEWVCDGFSDTDIYSCVDGVQYGAGYLHFHINWG